MTHISCNIHVISSISSTYFSTPQSGLIIDPGKSGTSTWDSTLNNNNGGWITDGIDKLDVDASSSIYLSYQDSITDGSEVSVNVSDSSVNVTGQGINTIIQKSGGTGLLVDHLETTQYVGDSVINNGTLGMAVDLGGAFDAGTFGYNGYTPDYFEGSSTLDAIDVLDARMANDLEFSTGTASNSINVSGYNEIDTKGPGRSCLLFNNNTSV